MVIGIDIDRAQEEWEALGLEKRIDYDNLKRVFERLDLKRDGRIDPEELADTYKVLRLHEGREGRGKKGGGAAKTGGGEKRRSKKSEDASGKVRRGVYTSGTQSKPSVCRQSGSNQTMPELEKEGRGREKEEREGEGGGSPPRLCISIQTWFLFIVHQAY